MTTPFYHADIKQHPEPNPLFPYVDSGGQRPPVLSRIAGAPQEEEPGGTISIARLILAGICPECGQPSLCPKCGLCHYCEDVDLPCLHAYHPLFPVLSHLGGARCL